MAWSSPRALLLAPLLLLALAAPRAASALPSDGWITFSSNREGGRHEVYVMAADGTNVRRLSQNGGKYSSWSPDGRWIAYLVTNTLTLMIPFAEHPVRVARWDGSEDKQIFKGVAWFWMYDGSGLVCSDAANRYYVVDPDSGTKRLLFERKDFGPFVDKTLWPGGISRDGRWLAAATNRYLASYKGENGQFKANLAAAVVDLQARDKVYYIGSGCSPTTSPLSSLVYHVRRDSPTWPDLYSLDLNDLTTRGSYLPVVAHADPDRGHEYFPRVSTDGAWLTYAAASSCHNHDTCDYEVHVHEIGGKKNNRARVTTNPANDQWPHMYVGPRWAKGDAPRLQVGPTSLTFEATAGGDPSRQEIVVKNLGSGTMALVTVKAGAGWVSPLTSGVGNLQRVSVGVETAGLEPGTYDATLEIDEPHAAGGPAKVQVTLSILDEGCSAVPASGRGRGWAVAMVVLLLALLALARR